MKPYLTLLLIGIVHHATPNPMSFVVKSPEKPIDAFLPHTIFKRSTPTPKITSMVIKSAVKMRYAITVVTTEVENPNSQYKEATFDVFLPEEAYISLFTMQVNGKEYKAEILTQEDASKVYQTQLSENIMTALVKYSLKPRFSNHFVVSTGLSAGAKAIFTLKYEEILPRIKDYYKLSISVDPRQIVPNFSINVNIKETNKITDVKVLAMKPGNQVDNDYDSDDENPGTINNINPKIKGTEASILFNPSQDEQQQLIGKFREKYSTKNSQKSEEGIEGQFEVHYKIEGEPNKLIVHDGYFVHFFSPENLKILSKHMVFVLDTSGSMWGEKINLLKNAMKSILHKLANGDCVSIVHFGNQGYVLTNPTEISNRNILNIINRVNSLQPMGGTNMEAGIKLGLDMIRNSNSNDNKLGRKTTIILFSDGNANQGKTGDQLIQFVKSQNSYQTPIYSLAFGKYASKDFLNKLSQDNRGNMQVIYYGSDADKQLVQFYKQLDSPILSNVQFTYPSNQVDLNTVTKSYFDTLQSKGILMVSGKIKQNLHPNSVEVQGKAGTQTWTGTPTLATSLDKLPMERFWAHLKVKTLFRERENNRAVDKKIIELSLKYSFVTPLTSLLVKTPEKQSTNNIKEVQPTIPRRTSARFNDDSDDDEEPFIPENTPNKQTENVVTAEETQIATSKLSKYDLDNYKWLEQFLSNDQNSATLPIQRKKRITVLLKPKAETVDFGELQPCSNAIDGGEGKCKYLLDCPNLSVGFENLQTYKNHYCLINGYAGICCKE